MPADSTAAFATLYEVLVTFAKLMAPVLPCVTETMYQGLVVSQRAPGDKGAASVHHEDYPEAIDALIDPSLEEQMSAIRRAVSLGRGLRVSEALRIRQPLARVTVVSHDARVRAAIDAHAGLIAEELNVKAVETSADEASLAHLGLKANFRALGPRFGSSMKDAAAAIVALDSEAIDRVVEGGEVEVLGITISLDDVIVTREARAGLAVATGEELSVALDTDLTEDLLIEGMARDIVKTVQGMRRAADLDVSDRITLRWDSDDPRVETAMERHQDSVTSETLVTVLIRDGSGSPWPLGENASITLAIELS